MKTKPTKNFALEEFACPCCGEVKISQKLIDQVQWVRDRIAEDLGREVPVFVTSGYRCPKHNKEVGGKENSQHLKGEAADLTCQEIEKLYSVCAQRFQAVGDGRSRGFVHVDTRPGLHRWVY